MPNARAAAQDLALQYWHFEFCILNDREAY
jgi:hypothetical protein